LGATYIFTGLQKYKEERRNMKRLIPVFLTIAALLSLMIVAPVTTLANGNPYTVNPTSGLKTTEYGGTDTFTIVLNYWQQGNWSEVRIALSSSDLTEGTVSPANITFIESNYNVPQTVTVTGVDDQVVDGNIAYTIDISYNIIPKATFSANENYGTPNYGDHVGVTNYDNDETPAIPIVGIASFVPDNPNLLLNNLIAVDPANLPPAGKPNMVFPQGFYSFTIDPVAPGQTVVVTITFPENIPAGSQYWRYNARQGWFDVTSLVGDNDGDNILTLTLTDGAFGDDDGLPNQKIVDAGGPGYPPAPSQGVGGEVQSVNQAQVLVPWLALTLVLSGVIGFFIVRRHRAKD
jgi:hypothetical protein